MKAFAFAIGATGLCLSAQAQQIWSPQINRNTGVATLVSYFGTSPGSVGAYGTIAVPANHFVSGLEFTPDGRLFATVQGPAGSMLQGLYTVNRDTGAAAQVGQPVGLAGNEIITDLAWNPVTHRLVGMATPSSGGLTSRLLNFDIHTGAVASASTVNSTVNVLHVGLTVRPNGEVFFLDVFNDWVSHLVGSNAILLGSVLSFKPAFNQGIGTDPETGTIWYAAFRSINPLQGTGQPELRTVNPVTGVDTFIGNLQGGSPALYTDAAVLPLGIYCIADLTNDNLVEDADFVSFASQYDAFECGSAGMTGGCSGDFNFDGVVDDADFVIFAVAYDALVCP